MSTDRLRQVAQARYMNGDLFGAEEAMREVVNSRGKPDPADVLTLARRIYDGATHRAARANQRTGARAGRHAKIKS